jgi:hypothetical protein
MKNQPIWLRLAFLLTLLGLYISFCTMAEPPAPIAPPLPHQLSPVLLPRSK